MPTLQDMTQISQPHVWFTTSEGGGGRFAYLSHVLHTYDVEKKKKTMKQHQTPKQRHRGIFFTPSESGRQSRRVILGEQVVPKKGSPDLDLQWLVSPKVLSPAKF